MHGLVIDDKKLHFSSSHFILEHDKCERLHGHNYEVKIELEGGLNNDFMVIDFKEAKDKIGLLCDQLDHKLLLPGKSKSLKISRKDDQIEIRSLNKFYSLPQGDCEIIPTHATTAEELASYIYREIKKDLPELKRVYVSESEGSSAYFDENDQSQG